MALKTEIERKWLVSDIPSKLNSYSKERILQGYILICEDGTEVRIRKKGAKYYQTFKAGTGKIREECEIQITSQQFKALWPLTQGKRIEKTRYSIRHTARLIELDIYRGRLKPLIIAEVEFASEKDSNHWSSPAWFGKEVTGEKTYSNQTLAIQGLPT